MCGDFDATRPILKLSCLIARQVAQTLLLLLDDHLSNSSKSARSVQLGFFSHKQLGNFNHF